MKRIISLSLVLSLLISALFLFPLNAENKAVTDIMPFTDVPQGSWFYGAVLYAYKNGLVNGTSETLFSPNVTVDRAMAVTVLARASGEDLTPYAYPRFSDCTKDDYFASAVEWAAENKIVSGTGDNKFSPHMTLTREQLAVMLANFAEYKDISLYGGGEKTLFPFDDRKEISSWAKNSIKCCVNEGLINGISESLLAPKQSCRRSELVTLVRRLTSSLFHLKIYQENYLIMGDMNISQEVPRYIYCASLVRMTGFGEDIARHIDQGWFSDIVADTPWVAFTEIAYGQGFIIPESEHVLNTGSINIKDAIYGALVAVGYRHQNTDDIIGYALEKGILDDYYGSLSPDKYISMGDFAELVYSVSRAPMVFQVKGENGWDDCVTYTFENKTLDNAYISGSDLSEGPVKVLNSGWDIFNPPGYHYGASMIRNEDGTLDIWMAGLASIRPKSEVDWAFYRRSYDNGASFTVDIGSGKPSYATEDWNWACDPGVIKIGDYYYMGYSSILWHSGSDNNLFISRGTDPANLSEEKWAGSYWSNSDAFPVITYTDEYHSWGCGEPSFVLMNDTIYCYVTWNSGAGNGEMTRLYTAPAYEENWPALLEYKGYCYTRLHNEDSPDIKYVDDYGCFVAFSTSERMTSDSRLTVRLSYDGVTFRTEQLIPEGDLILDQIHNCGVTGDEHGHMDIHDTNFVSYAYSTESSKWGSWPNRLAPVGMIGSVEYDDPSLAPSRDTKSDVDYLHSKDIVDIEITVANSGSCYMYVTNELQPQKITVRLQDKYGSWHNATDEEYAEMEYIYNSYFLDVDSKTHTVTPLVNRYAFAIIVKYGSVFRSIYVKPILEEYKPFLVKCEVPTLVFSYIGETKYPGIIVGDYAGNNIMIWGTTSSDEVYPSKASAETENWPKSVEYDGYDERIISIDGNTGGITAKRKGETTVIIKVGDITRQFKVVVK